MSKLILEDEDLIRISPIKKGEGKSKINYIDFLKNKGLEESNIILKNLEDILLKEQDMAIYFLGDGLKDSLNNLIIYYKVFLPTIINGEDYEKVTCLLDIDEDSLNECRNNIFNQLEIKYGHLYNNK